MTDVRIRVSRELSRDERQALAGGEADPFGLGSMQLVARDKDWHLFAEIDGRPVAHVGLLAHQVLAGDLPVAVAGVGGVLTAPDFRNQGLARRLLREASPLMTRTLGAEFGFLFCFPRLVPFYERLGWRQLEPPVLIEQPGGGEVEASPFGAMTLRLGARDWPPGAVRTRSLLW
jgi:GNAT superfamily N-acetyltransferase